MEHLEGNIPFCHAVDKGSYSLFIIRCGKRSRQPQTKGLCRRQCRLAGKVGVVFQDFLQICTADEEVIQFLAGHGKGNLIDGIRSHFKGNLVCCVDQHTVLVGSDIERDALIALVGACAAV